jgi:hypothetical protein
MDLDSSDMDLDSSDMDLDRSEVFGTIGSETDFGVE